MKYLRTFQALFRPPGHTCFSPDRPHKWQNPSNEAPRRDFSLLVDENTIRFALIKKILIIIIVFCQKILQPVQILNQISNGVKSSMGNHQVKKLQHTPCSKRVLHSVHTQALPSRLPH
ncbi:unnamed protein product [Albugo candida]|uniref:Uncharacterized protein n=1 Tax=Albugo candida TaxID=65357 RepID=A0A024FU35_9STRA|nr:unnamed protein product [Albugo candida]|eukprot:CCI10663.1 unnamed protein product [Albugo candida]